LYFLPSGVTSVDISDVRRMGGSNEVYSFILTYRGKGYQDSIDLILKIYLKSLEPVLKNYAKSKDFTQLTTSYPQLYCGKHERCLKEFQVLSSLDRVNFPVPKIFHFELDSSLFGSPFIIMRKEKLDRLHTDYLDVATKNLVRLHSLDLNALEIKCLKNSKDPFLFVRRCLLYFKFLMKLSSRHDKELTNNFNLAIRWLESNMSVARSPNYHLIHGDYHIYANAILTKSSRIFVMDWEDAEIGDPAFDVGYAFVRMRIDFDEKTADRFIQKYTRYSDGDIAERFDFYKLVVFLGEAILHSIVLSNPLTTYDIHGITAFLSYPFLRLPYNAKRTRADIDIFWVNCFKEFVKDQLIR
jgi:Phosphotransferase enzyme family